MSPAISRTLNGIGLLALCAVLLLAFGLQLINGELPCPLCLLQRTFSVGAGVGLALNVAVGSRPSHYAITILSAVAGAAVAIRQILLHIAPGTGAYGSALLGLHFYTWAFLGFSAVIVGSGLMLLVDRQFAAPAEPALVRGGGIGYPAAILFAILAVLNLASTVAECGGGMCPDNPTSYEFL